MMKRITSIIIICLTAVVHAFAAFTVNASKVTIEDLTVDKNNLFVVVEGSTSSGTYELAFDLWPATRSAIGSFNASNGTIGYVGSFVHKTSANGNPVDMWYYCYSSSAISLNIVSNGDGTCTLSGSIQATRNDVSYTYDVPDFTFAYSETPVPPEPEQDPYRFEPKSATTIDFVADVVHFRERTDYIEVTLNEMANETYDWIELRLLSDTMAMPAGVYPINASGEAGSLSASKGYLGKIAGDDPCYVAIRADKEDWGQYTPYYLESGSLTVSYNAKGDTILITGTVLSHNGTTVHVNARSYNMLYNPEELPPTPEDVTLTIDSVVITYLSNQSDSANHQFLYTLNFSHSDDYPTVLVDVTLSKPMELVAGTYSLEDGRISGLQLAQNQADFEANLFIGSAYDFVSASLVLSQEEDQWRYTMEMHDAIGSSYRFSLLQTPHIIFYPQPEVPEEDKPFAAETKEPGVYFFAPDTMIWKDETVIRDGIIDIILTCKEADAEGMRPYIHLGMYSDVAHPAAGLYPVNGSEESGSFSASLGRFGSVLIPCYVAIVDNNGAVRQIWFLVDGGISLNYDKEGQPTLQGECASYFGSTIQFRFPSQPQGLEELTTDPSKKGTKFIQDGKIYIRHGEHVYDLMGTMKE